MICSYIINVSLLGGIISGGVPLISTKKGSWYPETPPDSILHGLQGYNVAAKEYEEEEEWDVEVGS